MQLDISAGWRYMGSSTPPRRPTRGAVPAAVADPNEEKIKCGMSTRHKHGLLAASVLLPVALPVGVHAAAPPLPPLHEVDSPLDLSWGEPNEFLGSVLHTHHALQHAAVARQGSMASYQSFTQASTATASNGSHGSTLIHPTIFPPPGEPTGALLGLQTHAGSLAQGMEAQAGAADHSNSLVQLQQGISAGGGRLTEVMHTLGENLAAVATPAWPLPSGVTQLLAYVSGTLAVALLLRGNWPEDGFQLPVALDTRSRPHLPSPPRNLEPVAEAAPSRSKALVKPLNMVRLDATSSSTSLANASMTQGDRRAGVVVEKLLPSEMWAAGDARAAATMIVDAKVQPSSTNRSPSPNIIATGRPASWSVRGDTNTSPSPSPPPPRLTAPPGSESGEAISNITSGRPASWSVQGGTPGSASRPALQPTSPSGSGSAAVNIITSGRPASWSVQGDIGTTSSPSRSSSSQPSVAPGSWGGSATNPNGWDGLQTRSTSPTFQGLADLKARVRLVAQSLGPLLAVVPGGHPARKAADEMVASLEGQGPTSMPLQFLAPWQPPSPANPAGHASLLGEWHLVYACVAPSSAPDGTSEPRASFPSPSTSYPAAPQAAAQKPASNWNSTPAVGAPSRTAEDNRTTSPSTALPLVTLFNVIDSLPGFGLEGVVQALELDPATPGMLLARNIATFRLGPLGTWKVTATGRWKLLPDGKHSLTWFESISAQPVALLGLALPGLPPVQVQVPIQLQSPAEWNTPYLDGDTRISRGTGGTVFMFQRQPLMAATEAPMGTPPWFTATGGAV